jgi:hypothetical protein
MLNEQWKDLKTEITYNTKGIRNVEGKTGMGSSQNRPSA